MEWCGAVWRGVVWCVGFMWCEEVWCGVDWHGVELMVWCIMSMVEMARGTSPGGEEEEEGGNERANARPGAAKPPQVKMASPLDFTEGGGQITVIGDTSRTPRYTQGGAIIG